MEASALQAPAYLGRRITAGPLLRLRSDDQLVALFRMGYDEAFGVIHDRYRQRLFAYTRQMLPGARSDAEDALQDVFLRAYSALRDDDRPVTLRAWLYRVAHNRCVDQLRRPAPAASEIFDMSRLPLHDPLIETQLREDLRRLVCDVRRLPEQQRSALLMRELEGLSYTELADALGVTVPAVKSLLVRARMGLMEAGEARDAPCADIRAELSLAFDRGVRVSGRSRRHLRDCAGCRGYKRALRGTSQSFGALSGGSPWSAIAKVLGLGGAGSGAAVGGGAMGGSGAALGGGALAGGTVLGGGGAVVAGGGAVVVAKVAAAVCCAAVVVGGGAAQVGHRVHPRPAPKAAGAPGVTAVAQAPPSTGGVAALPTFAGPSGSAVAAGRSTGTAAGGIATPVVVRRIAQPTIEIARPPLAPVAAPTPTPGTPAQQTAGTPAAAVVAPASTAPVAPTPATAAGSTPGATPGPVPAAPQPVDAPAPAAAPVVTAPSTAAGPPAPTATQTPPPASASASTPTSAPSPAAPAPESPPAAGTPDATAAPPPPTAPAPEATATTPEPPPSDPAPPPAG